MTQDELVDLGKVLAAMNRLEKRVGELGSTVGEQQTVLMQMQSKVIELQSINQTLANEVMRLRHVMSKLACLDDKEHDTDPDCPALLSDAPPSHRVKLHSVSDDEPNSALTRPMELKVSKSEMVAKGPSIMVVAVGAILAAGAVVWAWLRHRIG